MNTASTKRLRINDAAIAIVPTVVCASDPTNQSTLTDVSVPQELVNSKVAIKSTLTDVTVMLS